MTRLIDLGWCLARLDTGDEKLTIMSPSEEIDSRYSPAESVMIGGTGNLIALRDALNEAYPPDKP